MNTQTQAQIYLADQRGLSETAVFRSYHTFNFGTYRAEGREPFGPLCLLNEDTLRAGASLRMQVEQDTQVLLLPVNGSLEHCLDLPNGFPVDEESADRFLEPRQAGFLSLPAGTSYTVRNPYEQEYIDFLQIWINSPGQGSLSAPAFQHLDVDLNQKNTLLPLFKPTAQHAEIRGYIGQFDGRQDNVYEVDSAGGVYVFVLQGAFEVANRLLHANDGLSLRDVPDHRVEFEALSNDAILILLAV